MQVPEAQRLGEEVPLEQRVRLLMDVTSYETFQYVAQGLFERHKLIVATQLCIAILRGDGKLQARFIPSLACVAHMRVPPALYPCSSWRCLRRCDVAVRCL